MALNYKSPAVIGAGIGIAVAALAGGVWLTGSLDSQGEPQWALIEQYCVDCHNRIDQTAGLALDAMSPTDVPHEPEIFEAVVRKLRGRVMPPPGGPQPSQDAVDSLMTWLETTLDDAAAARPHGARVPIHRLNRTEYAAEIGRLLKMDVDAASLLPREPESDGFDNVAAVLQVSPTFVDQYLAAARAISIRAVGDPTAEGSYDVFPAPENTNQTVHEAGLPLGTRGGMLVDYHFPADGQYEFNVQLSSRGGSLLRSYPTGWLEYRHRLILTIDGAEVFRAELGGEDDLKAVDQELIQAVNAIQDRFKGIRVNVAAGPHKVGVAFVARTFAESDAPLEPLRPGEGVDSVPIVTGLEIGGPSSISGVSETPSRRAIFVCRPANASERRPCAEQILSELARKAFRRPVGEEDLGSLLAFYDEGAEEGGFETGIQRGLAAILSSPKFLYRTEIAPGDRATDEPYALSDLQLASRLSFFLWGQGPDDALLELAERGELTTPGVYEAQVRRMLADPRSKSLVTNFAFQWLDVANIDNIDPDPGLFPHFDDDLRGAFRRELELYVDSIFRADASVLDLLTADHTFVNERLARHYGISSVRGSAFRRVELEDTRRRGLLGKGGILMATSYPDRTSPVLRGAWIMEAFIGSPPAAPPPGVETNLDNELNTEPKTVRARLEAHRAEPSCAQCHAIIDPLGLALENFNGIGEWRSKDRYAGTPIDASGRLVDGRSVAGPGELRDMLTERPDRFVQTFTEKLLIYALGRTVEYHDMPTVRRIVDSASEDDYRFHSIVMGIVKSDLFTSNWQPAEDDTPLVTPGAQTGAD